MWLVGALLQRGLGCEGGRPADLSSLCGQAALLLCVLGLPSLFLWFWGSEALPSLLSEPSS